MPSRPEHDRYFDDRETRRIRLDDAFELNREAVFAERDRFQHRAAHRAVAGRQIVKRQPEHDAAERVSRTADEDAPERNVFHAAAGHEPGAKRDVRTTRERRDQRPHLAGTMAQVGVHEHRRVATLRARRRHARLERTRETAIRRMAQYVERRNALLQRRQLVRRPIGRAIVDDDDAQRQRIGRRRLDQRVDERREIALLIECREDNGDVQTRDSGRRACPRAPIAMSEDAAATDNVLV